METTRPSETAYPEALIEKVARRIAIWNDDEDATEGVIWHPYIGDAVAALDALGVRDEWLILKQGDEWPHGLTTWTEAEARAAAVRNSERWGKYNAVHRYVTEWEVSDG